MVLRLNLADASPSVGEMEAAVARGVESGLRFFTLATAGDSVESRSRLYELVREGVVDDPGSDGTFLDFEEFSEQLFEPFYWRWAECQFLAELGDEWVGLTNLQLRDTGAEFGVTVVKRAFRGRGVARVLKLLALDHLLKQGIGSVLTRSDPRNSAVLRLNRRLGFRIDVPS